MSPLVTYLVLACAALLEAGGDLLVRRGMEHPAPTGRLLWMALGGVVLFAYGCVVNAPRWEFGRLLGIYVTLFFLAAQLIAWFARGERPGPSILIGGAMIIGGGAVILLGPR